MQRKRLISLLLAMMILLSTAIPVTSAFAYDWIPDYAASYHNEENWFGYQHTKDEVNQWVKEAVKAPTSDNDGILDMLTGEIRPGDVLSFQVKVEMPTHEYSEIVSLLDTMSLNMSLPYGVNALITAYCDEVPLLTEEQYNQKLKEYNQFIDEIEAALNSEELEAELESGDITKAMVNTYRDLVDNRDMYTEIYKRQLDIGRTKYGIISDFQNSDSNSYGSTTGWMGSFEEDPRVNHDKTYEEFRTDIPKESWVEPSITQEEYDLLTEQFNENYDAIIAEYLMMFDEVINAYENGLECDGEYVDEQTYQMVTLAKESIKDGTFYDTVIDYFDKKLNGFNQYGSDENANSLSRFLTYILTGQDVYNAYSGQYIFSFPDSIVQRNQECTYIFDINIVATNALSVGTYLSVPVLRFYFGEDCPAYFIQRDDSSIFQGEWRTTLYRECSTRRGWFNFGTGLCLNNYQYVSEDLDLSSQDWLMKDKRFFAYQFIQGQYGDDMSNLMMGEYLAHLMDSTYLNAIRPFKIEYVDENGNVIKTEISETNDAYYNVLPEEIYDFKLVGPDYIKGVIDCEDTTVTFHYEHKDAEIAVSYVDKNGNELAPSDTISGKTLDEYTTEPVEVYGYEPIVIPDNAAGVLHEDSDDIQYVYDLKDSCVKVNYLDESGNKLTESETINGKVFDAYSTNSKEFYGYILINEPDNSSGTMAEENADVNYIYRKIFDKLPDEPYTAVYGDKLSDIELPFGWEFKTPDADVGDVGSNTIDVLVPADEQHPEITGSIIIDVFPAEWIEGVDYGKLPDEPYKAIYGDKLSDIELPFGWVFDDLLSGPDATVGNVGTNTFNVTVPGDKNHPAIKGTVTIEVSPLDWIEGVDYGKLPDEPYKAIYGDKLSDIELPFGWVFDDLLSDPDATVGNVGTKTFNVTVPGNESHSSIKGTVTIEVSEMVEPEQPTEQPEEPTVPTESEEPTPPPEDNEPDIPAEEQPSEPVEDNSAEEPPSEPVEDIPTEKPTDISSDDKSSDNENTEVKSEKPQQIITPDTGSNDYILPITISTAIIAAVLLFLLCKKRKSTAQ